MPEGAIQSRTDFGTDGYGGPCPPKGDKPHHYHFTVFAVDADNQTADRNSRPTTTAVSRLAGLSAWWENTTRLTGQPRGCVKVLQTEYKQLQRGFARPRTEKAILI